MHLTSVLCVVAALPVILCNAVPSLEQRGRPWKHCLSDSAAAEIVEKFVNLFEVFDEAAARAILHPDFTEYSDSLNFLVPNSTALTGDPVVSGLENFIAYRKVVFANFGPQAFEVRKIWHGCDSITFLWRQNVTPVPVQGFDVLEIDSATGLVRAEYTEANTLAYLVNAGCQINCPTAAKRLR